ncbi:Rieske 2Fe-2S domain-containing protein [Undibacterium sp. Jales W-56]|uniref:Rieske (2Fe-2S) protein n=1 Tax=Undibacterium sp. Jales W-56 TaxID=2897325 RepID=UPI0021CF00FF|nr:Rieske 2Fe-2S domain-containing protein [Undibacterium sp. Jales W-56]MCU6435404.1 Rieske 2Fe-2S domain-containing protein [Undibacterium sp. Jales W-56]
MSDIKICDSSELIEGGKGIRFPVTAGHEDATGFVVRFDGTAHAYLNRCAHVPIELDWNPGEFFESSGLYIMCSTHGAIYKPENGYCTGGPCRGARLRKIEITEKDGQIVWHPDDYVTPVVA